MAAEALPPSDKSPGAIVFITTEPLIYAAP